MDADEIVPEETAKKIRESIDNSGDYAALEVKRKNFFFAHPLRFGGSYNYSVRLLRKNRARYIGRSVHERVQIDGQTGRIEADIFHYPLSSINDFIRKTNFYTELESEVFVRENDHIFLKEIKYRLKWKWLRLFWKLYIKKKGYRDGIYGLAWSVLNTIGPQLRWLKIWEKALQQGKLRD
jgi:hypothetical protein